MTPHEIFLCKTALRVLDSAGTQGVGREAWMEQVGITAQMPLTTAEQAALIDRLEVRYVLSGTGTLALGAL